METVNQANLNESQAAPPAHSDYTAGLVQTNEEREAVFALRMIVFVEEQNVPASEELDALDVTATHFLARRADAPLSDTTAIVGTARLVDKGEGKGKIGRVAVLREHRGRNVGALLMRAVEQAARERGFTYLALDAQCYAIPFYEKLGYTAQGDIFLDCAIEHRYMSKPL